MIRNINHPLSIDLYQYKHGPQKISNPTPDYVGWIKSFFTREGFEYAKEEYGRILKTPFKSTKLYKHYQANRNYKIEDFDTDESIKKWKPVADSDSLNGFSTATFVRSPAGHGLFKGVLDNRIPDDGLTQNSGGVGLIGPKKPRERLMSIETFWDWRHFNCVEIRYRGDGRKYGFVVNTGTYTDDTQYYDFHFYPLYTRGGPYWQTIRIPFGKLIFGFKSFIQDQQGSFPAPRVKFVAFILQDTYDGPFQLEIDYVALRRQTLPFQENSAYESYSHPHIKLKLLQVDCEAPDS